MRKLGIRVEFKIKNERRKRKNEGLFAGGSGDGAKWSGKGLRCDDAIYESCQRFYELGKLETVVNAQV